MGWKWKTGREITIWQQLKLKNINRKFWIALTFEDKTQKKDEKFKNWYQKEQMYSQSLILILATSHWLKWKLNCKIRLLSNSITTVPKPLYAELKAHIENLYNKGWIINSSSSYSLPVVSVGKKDGSLRLCYDYHQPNRKTIRDRYCLPKIQNILENLGGRQYCSILDQGKAYHQIHLSPESRHLTAFIIPWGFYEWVRVPFDFMNSLAVLLRFMGQSFQDYRDHFVVP